MLITGIFAMVLMRIGHDDIHRLQEMEPANPFGKSNVPIVELSEIHPERTLNVWVNGRIVKMGLEEYVFGVLAAEMPATFSMEALKAQAVAARTLAVYKIMYGGCSKYDGADVCDESGHCQAYLTANEIKSRWKGNFDSYAAKLTQAVNGTAGKIITYADKPILVLFHASSAGYTENVENVYSQALPYLRGVPSPGESSVTTLESKEEYDMKWFANTVNKAYPKAGLNEATLEQQVTVAGRFPSGRVKEVKLGKASLSGVEFRRLLDIRSANFSFGFNKYSVIVTTEGYGHGVGMSQNGAEAMAREGSDYIDILNHYYTGVQVVDMK
jgi:stage II sporulation protein D